MDFLSRRTLLKSSVANLIASILEKKWSRNFFASEPALIFPAQPRQRLAVSSWPFRALIESPVNRNRDPKQPGMDLKDFPSMVVSRFSLHRLEPLGEHLSSTDSAYLKEFQQAVERAHCQIVNMPIPVGVSLYDPDLGMRQKAVENSKKWVNIALVLGSPSIQVEVKGVPSVSPDVERAAESLKQITDYGAQKGVVINLENDNLVSEDAFFLVKVIEKVKHPYLRALPDFCNSMLSGDDRFNYEAVSAMFRHAYNISHVKDSELDAKGKLFRVDLAKTFGIAKASGYRGYFSMEWEGGGSPYEGTQKLIEQSLECLG